MANIENLKPFDSTQDREEAKKNGRKGGKRSGEVRREKANFKRILTEVFEGKPSKPLIDILKQAGIENPDKLNYLEAIIAFGALKTHSKRTSLNELTRFLEFGRDSMGQKPTEKVEATNATITVTDEKTIESVMNKLKDL